ncbi:MAG TPA: type II CAAX endopeptidase family protein [Pyrinomonadaceae bacterium]|nr:type II CAAX endopeptidase family protein [Pyrinomonadaceae bacterium]
MPQNSLTEFADGALPSTLPTPETPHVPDPDNPPWSIFGAVGVWLASVFLLALLPALFVIAYAQQRGIGVAQLAEFSITDKVAIFLQILSNVPAHILTMMLAWMLVTRFGKRPFFSALGWQWSRRFGFWTSAGLAVGLLGIGILVIKLAGEQETPLDKVISSSRAAALATAFIATATAPLVEEVIYRGVLYSALQRAIGAVGAVFIVLSLFALVHVPQYWPNFGVIGTICLLSAVLTLIRAWTGQLLPCVIVHLIFNGLQSIGIVVYPYLQRAEPTATPETTVTGWLVALISHFVN